MPTILARLAAMFDLRYHAVSLAAVFVALAVGILLGIGVADRGLVDRGKETFLRAQVDDLNASLDDANARLDRLERQQRAAAAFMEEGYPSLTAGRLAGKRIALVFVGRFDGVRGEVEDALRDAGAPPLLRARALRVPVDEDTIRTRYGGSIDELGRSLGRELVLGERTPLWDRLSALIVEEQSGRMGQRADGIIVVRSAEPQAGGTARLLRGLYEGIASAGAPAVGVERSDAGASATEVFRSAGLSSVDDVETPPGKLALVLLLAGARGGNYGVKETADDGPLPALESAPRPAAG
jgi:hypothetical protein